MTLAGTELEKTAELLARRFHGEQKRRMGEDKGKLYVDTHLFRMAQEANDSVDAAVAWLHDSLEDTVAEVDDLLKAGIPREVVDTCMTLTRKEGESYFAFIMRIRKSKRATRLKLADLEDNATHGLHEGSLKDKYRLTWYVLTNTGPVF
jgi:hypothetical protein